MAVTAMEKAIQEATGVKASPRKDRQKYFVEIVDAVATMPEDTWNDLSKEAQEWCNGAIRANNDGKEIEDFSAEEEPTTTSEAAEASDANTEEQQVATSKSKKKKGNGAATSAKKKSAAKKPATEAKKPAAASAKSRSKKPATAKSADKPKTRARGGGNTAVIKQLLLKDLAMSRDDMKTALEKKGIKLSDLTVSTIMSDFKHSLRVVQDAGHLKGLTI